MPAPEPSHPSLDAEAAASAFVRAATRIAAVPLVPELRLHIAVEALDLWRLDALVRGDAPLPFWAFPWAGGQALARYLLDHPEAIRGGTVLDVGSGSGLVAIAAARAGAARVVANDIDPHARAAIALNAALNAVEVSIDAADQLAPAAVADSASGSASPLHNGGEGPGVRPPRTEAFDVLLIGDLWYEASLAARTLALVLREHARGVTVLTGDLGRPHFPADRFEPLATYEVPVAAGLEDADVKRTTVWRPR